MSFALMAWQNVLVWLSRSAVFCLSKPASPCTAVTSCGLPSQDGPVAFPVTVNVQSGWDAPGQLILYVPGWMVSEKPPESPGVRFSCSPRMCARSEVRSSASDTEPAPELVTLKSTGPAGILAGLGSQPEYVTPCV